MAVRRKFDLRFKETVLQYAEETSGEQAARFFNIDSKRIRYWRKQRAELRSADEGRARLSRDGRKTLSVELERRLSEWIHAMRDRRQAVSADMIKNKALEIYPTVSDGGSRFVASTGWLQKFLKRYNLSLRRCSAVTQEDPNLLTEKLVWFVDYVGKTVSAKRILEKDIITMDETVAWFDASSLTQGVQGQEKSQLTIVLAAKADGTKLKPFIVFRGAAGDEEAMQQQISGAVINTSPNGWINDALVSDWLETVVGKSNATPRLLVWDSQRSHVSVTGKLKHDFNITPAVIPRGCTEYIQAHNVMWNQPLKQNLHDAYDRWMAGDYQKEYTAGGDLKPPARRLLVDWVVTAWDKLDTDMIRESFKVCGLSVKSDGSEDDLIACFKEGQPCAAGRDMLTQARQRSWENWSPVAKEEDGVKDFYFEEEDEEELVFEEEEEDGDHTSLHCITHQVLTSFSRVFFHSEDEDDDDEDDDFTTGSSTTSQHPMKRRRDGSASFRAREEEEGEEARWHNKEEKDKRPDPLRFIPVREPGPTLDPTASWSPLSLFQLFFSDSVVCTIIENTNANAAKRLKSGLKFVWKPLTTVQRKVKEAGVWQTKNITIPDPIVEYNRNRGGVDLSDALISCYSAHHKTMKWYKRFFYHFMDIAVVNSFLLHKELHKKKNDSVVKKPLSQKRFREKLAAEMLWYAKDSAPPTSTPAACMPAYFGDNGTESRKYCKRCQDAGIKRMKTPVYCMKCQVPLCFNARRNCFKDWHNK
ncbi:hypothetical protein ABVT39_021878 [Epinephelus coioides]